MSRIAGRSLRTVLARATPLQRRTHATAVSMGAEEDLQPVRHEWRREEVQQLFDSPLLELVFRSAWKILS